jgi:hypothetical protein
LYDFAVLCEWHDGKRPAAEEHEREAVFGALFYEVGQQFAGGPAFLRTSVPSLLGSDYGVDRAPVTGQHPLVHAATPVDEDNDLCAAAGSDDLCLWPTGGGQAHDDARDRQNGEGGA